MPNIEMSLLEVKGIQMNALLALLEENFPPFTPHPQDPDRMIMYKSGQRSVIEWITHYIEDNG